MDFPFLFSKKKERIFYIVRPSFFPGVGLFAASFVPFFDARKWICFGLFSSTNKREEKERGLKQKPFFCLWQKKDRPKGRRPKFARPIFRLFGFRSLFFFWVTAVLAPISWVRQGAHQGRHHFSWRSRLFASLFFALFVQKGESLWAWPIGTKQTVHSLLLSLVFFLSRRLWGLGDVQGKRACLARPRERKGKKVKGQALWGSGAARSRGVGREATKRGNGSRRLQMHSST